ncbi:hypothetical protein [Actinoplanes sp. NPDC051851]|uniref:hypothetical protein n=1 Tax=Actinoplanes sp. NPDC051851 TaxID=3154753 RepID=UPI0034309B3D
MIRRNAPVLGLYFLAPLVAEFLLGNLPVVYLPAVVVLAPMYGGGALLIREAVRRRGSSWVNMLILALAYALLEEALVTQSLFNPNYADEHLLVDGYLPALGIGAVWTIYVLSIHVFWSMAASILMVEVMVAPEKRTVPWMGRRGLTVTGVLFILGLFISGAINMAAWPYTSTPAQFAVSGVLVVALIVLGLLWRVRLPGRSGRAPSGWVVLTATLVAGGIFQGVTLVDGLPVWAGVTIWVVDVVGYLTLIAWWSAGEGWNDRHRLAIGAGALLTYAWHSFTQPPAGGNALLIDMIGNTVCSVGALLLIWSAWRRIVSREATE